MKERESGFKLSIKDMMFHTYTITFLASFLSTANRLRGSFHIFVTGPCGLILFFKGPTPTSKPLCRRTSS